MAQKDIYDSKAKYERFKRELDELLMPDSRKEYVCKNEENLEYFRKLFHRFCSFVCLCLFLGFLDLKTGMYQD